MKKILCSILTLLFLFSLVGCSQEKAAETDMPLTDIVAAVTESQSELPALKQITSKDQNFDIWISDYYSLQKENVEDGVICYADGVEASEIAVLALSDEEDCRAAEKALTEYIQDRAGAFEGYAPQQAAMVKDGIIVENGRYMAFLICPEPSAAKSAFLGCFEKNPNLMMPRLFCRHGNQEMIQICQS
ncbi:MAG: DUF4358 domain-containing protein [Eubacteriales bacterium]|nr:DUF4358 domain-containing protein [Eubacteriales bacterium]